MLNKLNTREKYAVYGVIAVVGLIFVYEFMISPLVEARERKERAFVSKTRDMNEIVRLKSEYEAVKKMSASTSTRISERRKNFTLFSFLDDLAGEAKIKDHISYMKPSTSTPKDGSYKISQVEMKLQTITMAQLTTYLYKVETSKNRVFVKRLSIAKDNKQQDTINVVLQVETPEG